MKVLVADKFEKSGLDDLKAAGCDNVFEPDLADDGLAEAIRASQADVLVVRSTKVTAAMLDAGRLSLIVRAGAGYNTIDVAAASTRGIYVSNCPGRNAIAVAELAFGLILSLDRRIPDNVAELRAGTWNKKEYSKARGLYGCTLGLLGIGNIGLEMIRRAAGFGMNVMLWSRNLFDRYYFPAAYLGGNGQATAANGNEWVMLRNATPFPMLLDGVALGDEETVAGTEGMYTVPAGVTLAAGGTFVAASSGTDYNTFFGRRPDAEWTVADTMTPDMTRYTAWGTGNIALANAGRRSVSFDHVRMSAECGFGNLLDPLHGFRRPLDCRLQTARQLRFGPRVHGRLLHGFAVHRQRALSRFCG